MTPPERNSPGYTPEYKELEEARIEARELIQASGEADTHEARMHYALDRIAAEVRVMRLERALER